MEENFELKTISFSIIHFIFCWYQNEILEFKLQSIYDRVWI